MWLGIVITALAGYLLGNLNGAVCISALMNDDVRSHGSGNAGLTNFVRNYGFSRALYVILIDAGKAVVACLLGGFLLKRFGMWSEGAVIGGLGVIVGHSFPVFLGFRGGKGILSGLFVAVVCDWRIALILLGIFALAYLLSGYVSVGSVLAATAFSVCFGVLHWGEPVVMVCGILTGALAVFQHRSNIRRLFAGQEKKTSLFKKGNGK